LFSSAIQSARILNSKIQNKRGDTVEAFKDWLKPELIWFLIGLVLMLLEFVLPGFIIFFFGVGAWIVALICLFADISINVQLILFLVASVLLLLSLRKWMRGVFVGHKKFGRPSDDDQSEFTGKKAVVTRTIHPVMGGKVELHGTSWNAETDGDEPLEEGTAVEITGKHGLTLKVRKYPAKGGNGQ
jgi:membrane protein implicated in regulation of membrane protease activity